MLIIKLSTSEADATFPYDLETEKPTGEVDMARVNKIWAELDGNSGPYPQVAAFENWAVLDCFDLPIITDEHGDELIDVATATIRFMDQTTLDVKFQCYNG